MNRKEAEQGTPKRVAHKKKQEETASLSLSQVLIHNFSPLVTGVERVYSSRRRARLRSGRSRNLI